MRYISIIILTAFLAACCHDYAQIKNPINDLSDNKIKKHLLMPESDFVKQPAEIKEQIFNAIAEICNYNPEKIQEYLESTNKGDLVVSEVDNAIIVTDNLGDVQGTVEINKNNKSVSSLRVPQIVVSVPLSSNPQVKVYPKSKQMQILINLDIFCNWLSSIGIINTTIRTDMAGYVAKIADANEQDVFFTALMYVIISKNKDNMMKKLNKLDTKDTIRIINQVIECSNNVLKFNNNQIKVLEELLDISTMEYCKSLLSRRYIRAKKVDGGVTQKSEFENFMDSIGSDDLRKKFLILMSYVEYDENDFYIILKNFIHQIKSNKEIKTFLDRTAYFLRILAHVSDNIKADRFFTPKLKLVEFINKQIRLIDYLGNFNQLKKTPIMILDNENRLQIFDSGGNFKSQYKVKELLKEQGSASFYKGSNINCNVMVKFIDYDSAGSDSDRKIKDFSREKTMQDKFNAGNFDCKYIVQILDMGFVRVNSYTNLSPKTNSTSSSSSSSISSVNNSSKTQAPIKLCTIMTGYNYTLDELIKNNQWDSVKLKEYLYHAVLGVKYLHSKGLVYHNVNPNNIAVKVRESDKTSNALLINLENVCSMRDIAFESCGERKYQAPEMLNPEMKHIDSNGQEIFGYERKGKADVWALGLILCEIFKIKAPYEEKNINTSIDSAKEISQKLADLLQGMLNPNCNERFNIDQVINHPFFANCCKRYYDQELFQTMDNEDDENAVFGNVGQDFVDILSIPQQNDKVFHDKLLTTYNTWPIEKMEKMCNLYKSNYRDSNNRCMLMTDLLNIKIKEKDLKQEVNDQEMAMLDTVEVSEKSIKINGKVYVKVRDIDQIINSDKDKIVGTGYFSQVLQGTDSNGIKVAIKVMPVYVQTNVKNMVREVKIMKYLRRYRNMIPIINAGYKIVDKLDNFIKEKNSDTDSTLMYIYIITPLCEEGTLYGKLEHYRKNKQQTLFDKIKKYLYDVLKAVRAMHIVGYLHRDIKPDNLLIHHETVFLSDFGFTELIKDIKTLCGTRYYMAPEMLYAQFCPSLKMDIWSIGMILSELYDIFDLSNESQQKDLFKAVQLTNGSYEEYLDYKYIQDIITDLYAASKECGIDLIYHMLDINQEQRYDIDQVLIHQFFRLFRIEEIVFLLGHENFINWMQRISKDIKSHLDFVKKSVMSNSDKHKNLIKDITELCSKDKTTLNAGILHKRILNLLGRHECKICIGKIPRYDVIAYYNVSQTDQTTNIINIVFSEDMIEFLENLKARMSAEEFKIELGGLILNQLQQLNNQKYDSVVIELKQKNLFTFFKEMEWLKPILKNDKCGIIMKIISVVRTLFKPISNIPNCLEPLFGNFDTELFSQNIHSIICAV
jgi:serine/threonine protein kinase